jgi:hypothetical protein
MFHKLSFGHFVGVALALSFIMGFAAYVLAGATTNRGTTRAIGSESATIMRAEKASCSKFGRFASISTLRKDGLLAFEPVYNSVVYLPGPGCGTIVVGSLAYQSPAG